MAHYPIYDLDRRYRKVPHVSSIGRLAFEIICIVVGILCIAGTIWMIVYSVKQPVDPIKKATSVLDADRATWKELRP